MEVIVVDPWACHSSPQALHHRRLMQGASAQEKWSLRIGVSACEGVVVYQNPAPATVLSVGGWLYGALGRRSPDSGLGPGSAAASPLAQHQHQGGASSAGAPNTPVAGGSSSSAVPPRPRDTGTGKIQAMMLTTSQLMKREDTEVKKMREELTEMKEKLDEMVRMLTLQIQPTADDGHSTPGLGASRTPSASLSLPLSSALALEQQASPDELHAQLALGSMVCRLARQLQEATASLSAAQAREGSLLLELAASRGAAEELMHLLVAARVDAEQQVGVLADALARVEDLAAAAAASVDVVR